MLTLRGETASLLQQSRDATVAREGKENPDFYLMSNPNYAAFLLNWVVA